jgi:hypothetical protein
VGDPRDSHPVVLCLLGKAGSIPQSPLHTPTALPVQQGVMCVRPYPLVSAGCRTSGDPCVLWRRLGEEPTFGRSLHAAMHWLCSMDMRLCTYSPASVRRQSWLYFVYRSMPIDSMAVSSVRH